MKVYLAAHLDKAKSCSKPDHSFFSKIVPQFQCKTLCELKRAFLASWLKERGIHISDSLVSARGSGLKIRE